MVNINWEQYKVTSGGVEETIPEFLWSTSALLATELSEHYNAQLGPHKVENGTLLFQVLRDGKELATGRLVYDIHHHVLTMSMTSQVSKMLEITTNMNPKPQKETFSFDNIKFALALLLPDILESAGML